MRLRDLTAHVAHHDPVRRVATCRCAVRDVDARCGSQIAPRAGEAIDGRSAGVRVEDTRLRHGADDRCWIRPAGSPVGRHREGLERLPALCADAEEVRIAVTVGSDRAAVRGIAVAVVRGRADLLLRPGAAAVTRDGDLQWRRRRVRALLLTAERGPANVDVSEERTGRSVVRPDLLLVGERCRGLLRDDHRRHPGALVVCGSRLHVVCPGDGDRLEAFEFGVGTEGAQVRGEVRVIQARAIRPRKGPIRALLRAERDGRVAIGDEAILEVPRERADRTDRRRACRIGRSGCPLAATRAEAGVRRLRPGLARVE